MRKKIWLFILIPILLLSAAGGAASFYLQTKLKAGGDSAKTEVVNAVIKEAVTHPSEIKRMMDSMTITDGDESTSSEGKEMPGSPVEKSAPTPSSSTAAPVKRKAAPDSSSIFSLKYMRAHQAEYELLSTGAKKLGGNTYRLTATVKHKPTGKISTVAVTTQLSESMKETLKSYRK